jgi:flagellar protein FlbD
VTRLNGEQFALNPDLIERVEGHPDTVVFLVDGTRYIVRENVEEVLVEIREYRASILATAYEMDRGTYRPSRLEGAGQGEDPAQQGSVVPFPAREER